MITHENIPIKKFAGLKRYEPVAIDSSAMKEFQRCPRAYFFRTVLGFVAPDEKIYFAWGKAIHKFYEMAEIHLKQTNNIQLSLALAIQNAVTEWGSTKDALPDSKKYKHMTKQNLSTVLLFIAEKWRIEKESGNLHVTQTEAPFVVQLSNGVWISGRIDQVINWSGRYWIRDFKSTTKKWSYYKYEIAPADQFARYTAAFRLLSGLPISGAVVDVICSSPETKTTLERETVTYTTAELDDWEKSQLHWDAALKKCREEDHYPMCERSCNRCDYREICTTRGESSQLYVLKSKFKLDVWDNAKG